ncbi:MAG: hypothetical protein ACTHJ4_06845 [Candidatus Nucleicultricaceae bacterium]
MKKLVLSLALMTSLFVSHSVLAAGDPNEQKEMDRALEKNKARSYRDIIIKNQK